MKQKIGTARALYNDPQMLIFDEPTSYLDYQSIEIFNKNINNYFNITIIIISHDMNVVKNCNILYEIQDKKIYQK